MKKIKVGFGYKLTEQQQQELLDNFCKLQEKNKKLEEKYKRLSIEAQATAFDDENKDTEGLLRVLLKQGEISLDENGYYKRQDFDWEENMFMLGLMKKREKTFYIPDDECLDEYTKQLESQLKEYNEIKKIFKKYLCFPNDTMYDGCCKMQDEIDKYKELQKVLNEKNIPIETLLAEFDRLEDIEDDRDCNYIPKSKVQEKIEELSDKDLEIYETDSEDVIISKYEDRAVLDFCNSILED